MHIITKIVAQELINADPVLKILKAADEILSDESKWTKDYGARNKRKAPVDIFSDNAVCFCVAGAIELASYKENNAAGYGLETMMTFKDANNLPSIPRWNDNFDRTFTEVKAAFAEAIAFREKQLIDDATGAR